MKKTQLITGIGTSSGIIIGKAYVFDPLVIDCASLPAHKISKEEVKGEFLKLEAALEQARQQINDARNQAIKRVGLKNAQIFDAHILLLEDKVFLNQVKSGIKNENYNAAYSFCSVAKEFLNSFKEIDDDYFRERTADIKDVFKRVMNNIIGKKSLSLEELEEDVIIVAHDLSPSETATMHKERVVGMITEIGGPTSHTSIMARALEIPSVSGVHNAIQIIHDGDSIIVDGTAGTVILNPTKKQIVEYREKQQINLKRKRHTLLLKDKPAVTKDDHKVTLLANIEIPEEAKHAMLQGAAGIGLYRTEFFFMNRNDLPTEDEQFEAYSYVAKACGDKPVTIRTLDLGGDKFASALSVPKEMNPFMGWRAIRMCLERTDLFKAQLRAILRASENKNVRIMFPMIATIQEVRAAKKLIEESKKELRNEGKKFDDNIQIGIMIEIPSAAMTADVFAEEVDFFSIGTNDLIQYCLAVDRINEKTAHMYDPLNLAVMRMIKIVIDVAHNTIFHKEIPEDHDFYHAFCPFSKQSTRKPIKVCVCGEIAAQPELAYLMLGFGIDELSTASIYIPGNKELLRAATYKDAVKTSNHALRMSDTKDVKKLLADQLSKLKLNLDN